MLRDRNVGLRAEPRLDLRQSSLDSWPFPSCVASGNHCISLSLRRRGVSPPASQSHCRVLTRGHGLALSLPLILLLQWPCVVHAPTIPNWALSSHGSASAPAIVSPWRTLLCSLPLTHLPLLHFTCSEPGPHTSPMNSLISALDTCTLHILKPQPLQL